MGEQAVKKLRVVTGSTDSQQGEQAVGLVTFVDATGAPTGAGLEIPEPPAAEGTYNLQVVRAAGGAVTYSWVAAE